MKKTLLVIALFFVLQNIKAQIVATNVTDSLALVDLYDSTGGANWLHHDGWLNGPVSSWYGIGIIDSFGRIQYIFLNDNNLIGSLPNSLGNLASLKKLDLYNNYNLIGVIPISIGNLINLEKFDISVTKISGDIPISIGNLTNLKYLDLECSISGFIPTALGNLTNLQYLALGSSQLSGSIPASIGNLINLQDLTIVGPLINGSIPISIGNLVNLKFLALGSSLTGDIPMSIGNLINLNILYLQRNQLSGFIPSSLGNLINLKELHLDHNQLSGDIPSSFGSLSQIVLLDLSFNYLTGNIPNTSGNLLNLTYLYLNNNKLKSPIPILYYQNLLFLNLANNSFVFDGGLINLASNNSIRYKNYGTQNALYDSLIIYKTGIAEPYSLQPFLVNSGFGDTTDLGISIDWFKNDILYETVTGTSTKNDYYPTLVKSGDVFYAKISHRSAPGLILVSKKIMASDVAICTTNTWAGTVSTAWEDPVNWSCGIVPDLNTTVIINAGLTNYPLISSNATCKMITVSSSANITIKTGFNLIITGK